MYSVFADDICIYDDSVENIQVKLIDPKLTMEDSSAGSLEFTLPTQNVGYGNKPNGQPVIELMKTTFHVFRTRVNNGNYETEEIWEGRAITEEFDFYNNRRIYCEGELAYLNDTTQPQAQYFGNAGAILDVSGFLRTIIANHNKKVDSSKQFTVGAVTVHQESIGAYRYTDYGTTLEAVNKLVEDVSGHLRIRKQNGIRYLDWYAEFGQSATANQSIEFGVNLLDVSKTKDLTKLCTVLLPLGKKTTNGGTTTIGDEITVSWQPDGTWIDGNGVMYPVDPTTSAYYGHQASYAIEVQPEHTYFITCRNTGIVETNQACAMYVVTDALNKGDYGQPVMVKSASGAVATDIVEEKITIPAMTNPGHTYYLYLCTLTQTALKARVYDSKEIPENLDEYITVESVNNGSLFVQNSALISKYGWIERQHVWDDVEDPAILMKRAQNYLATGQFEEDVLEVTALDLLALGYRNYRGLNVLDIIHVKSEPHGIDKYLPITKIEIPLNDPANMQFTIGVDETKNLTQSNAEMNESLLAKIGAIPSSSTLLQNAYEDAANLINAATGGYITIEQNEQGTATAQFIVSNVPYDQIDLATNVWLWNVNGLCHVDSWPPSGQNMNLALTMDGQIVADRMTTGTLRAIQIVGCDMTVFDGDSAQQAEDQKEPGWTTSEGWVRLYKGRLRGGIGAYVDPNGKMTTTNEYGWLDCHADIYDIDDARTYRGWRWKADAIQIWSQSFATRKADDFSETNPPVCWKGGTGQVWVPDQFDSSGNVTQWKTINFVNGLMVTYLGGSQPPDNSAGGGNQNS